MNQITNVINVFSFEAVSRTYRQFKVINRTKEDRIDLFSSGNRLWQLILLQIDKYRDLLLQNCGRTTDSLFRLDDLVVSYPRINEPILGGSGQISGNFTVQESNDLAIVLRSGALQPVVDQSVPAQEAQAAYARLEAGEQFGKIVFRW